MGGMISQFDRDTAHELLADFEPPEDPTQTAPAFMLRPNDEITARERAKDIDMPDLNYLRANNPAAPVEFIFPHYFLLPQFGNMSSYRIRPLMPETCLFELWSLLRTFENMNSRLRGNDGGRNIAQLGPYFLP